MKKAIWLSFCALVFPGILLLLADVCAADLTVIGGGPSGGKGGSVFVDSVIGGQKIAEVRIRSGTRIDSIQVVYRDARIPGSGLSARPKHGGNGGSLAVFELSPDEHIVSIGGKYGDCIDSLWIRTSKGRFQRWGGNGGSVDFHYAAPDGWMISSFWGRSGTYLDSIGVQMSATE